MPISDSILCRAASNSLFNRVISFTSRFKSISFFAKLSALYFLHSNEFNIYSMSSWKEVSLRWERINTSTPTLMFMRGVSTRAPWFVRRLIVRLYRFLRWVVLLSTRTTRLHSLIPIRAVDSSQLNLPHLAIATLYLTHECLRLLASALAIPLPIDCSFEDLLPFMRIRTSSISNRLTPFESLLSCDVTLPFKTLTL